MQDILAIASDTHTNAAKLTNFGQIALEQGWYEQAREYFEQALDLDPASREALEGLVRVNEVLSHGMETPIEPIMLQPVAPPREVERKRNISDKKHKVQIGSSMPWFQGQPRHRKLIILAGLQVLLLYLCTGLAGIINPTSKATPMAASLGTPMPAGPDEEAFAEMTEQWGTIVDAVSVIETEQPESTAVSEVEGGWLCDLDERGEAVLWSKPAVAFQEGNSIAAIVGMPVKGCIDVTLLDEATSGSTVFYEVRVGDNQGWVDADYFYPTSTGKPHWSP